MLPYILMALLYFSMAVLAAADSALTGMQIVPAFNGLRWLRVHFITLGAISQVIFGLLPLLAAARAKLPRPSMRWDIWIALNSGLLTLLVGIPLYQPVLIIFGGTLIFTAVLLLIGQLAGLRPQPAQPTSSGRKFYIAGLAFFLVGIIVGSGLWFGWAQALRIRVPIEVHIHANIWGFMSLVFAGLLVDLYPGFSGRPLAWPRSVEPIFWLMVTGALALLLGPWLPSPWYTTLSAPGLILHLTATLWLLANLLRPLLGNRHLWTPGMFHLFTSYGSIFLMVLLGPLVILGVLDVPSANIEANLPQLLIYGWVLQFGYALLPYVFRRALLPDEPARLGGSWFSLLTVHTGSIFLLLSILPGSAQPLLHGIAYTFWALSMLPIFRQLGQIVRSWLVRQEAAILAP